MAGCSWPWSEIHLGWRLGSVITSGVTWCPSFNLSEPQFPHLCKRHKSHLAVLKRGGVESSRTAQGGRAPSTQPLRAVEWTVGVAGAPVSGLPAVASVGTRPARAWERLRAPTQPRHQVAARAHTPREDMADPGDDCSGHRGHLPPAFLSLSPWVTGN